MDEEVELDEEDEEVLFLRGMVERETVV